MLHHLTAGVARHLPPAASPVSWASVGPLPTKRGPTHFRPKSDRFLTPGRASLVTLSILFRTMDDASVTLSPTSFSSGAVPDENGGAPHPCSGLAACEPAPTRLPAK